MRMFVAANGRRRVEGGQSLESGAAEDATDGGGRHMHRGGDVGATPAAPKSRCRRARRHAPGCRACSSPGHTTRRSCRRTPDNATAGRVGRDRRRCSPAPHRDHGLAVWPRTALNLSRNPSAQRHPRPDSGPPTCRTLGLIADHPLRAQTPTATATAAGGWPWSSTRRTMAARLCGVNLAFLWMSTRASFRETVGVTPSVSSVGVE